MGLFGTVECLVKGFAELFRHFNHCFVDTFLDRSTRLMLLQQLFLRSTVLYLQFFVLTITKRAFGCCRRRFMEVSLSFETFLSGCSSIVGFEQSATDQGDKLLFGLCRDRFMVLPRPCSRLA